MRTPRRLARSTAGGRNPAGGWLQWRRRHPPWCARLTPLICHDGGRPSRVGLCRLMCMGWNLLTFDPQTKCPPPPPLMLVAPASSPPVTATSLTAWVASTPPPSTRRPRCLAGSTAGRPESGGWVVAEAEAPSTVVREWERLGLTPLIYRDGGRPGTCGPTRPCGPLQANVRGPESVNFRPTYQMSLFFSFWSLFYIQVPMLVNNYVVIVH
jgi:hypothetical protein